MGQDGHHPFPVQPAWLFKLSGTVHAYDGRPLSQDRPVALQVCHRLMYRCPASHDDGMDVNFRSPDLRTAGLFETIHALGLRYDIVLVDSFHTYDVSYRDLADALRILTDRGTVVVHDCLPPTEDLVGRDWTPGSWCGVTFMAYIDFLNDHPELAYTTVDADFGCGIVRKGGPRLALPTEMADGWSAARR